MTPKRQFSPYETKQLRLYGFDGLDVTSVGEKPVEYITGHVEFCHHDFYVNKHTLIPRIESEEIIDLANELSLNFPKDKPIQVADIGTGSGCLGISTALVLNQLGFDRIDLFLSDISTDALKVASANASRLLPKTIDVETLKSDLLTDFPTDTKINILLANLPYVPSDRIPKLDSSVKDFEPRLALDGGPKGTTTINRLLKQLAPSIDSNFLGIFEIDSTQCLNDFYQPENLTTEIKKDMFERDRFLILKAHNI